MLTHHLTHTTQHTPPNTHTHTQEINFNQYLKSVERVQMNMFLETNRGRKVKKQFKEEAKKQ
jgi:hypothetical protein